MGAQAVRLSNVDIDNALKNKDFEVLFQPIFDLSNGALARVETFVRWRHASLGVLPPGAFISFFESQGRMSELTRYVLSEALTQYKGWRGPYAPGFSINLALSDLGDEAFVSHFGVLLREYGFPTELVTLECPMPPVDQDLEVAARNFERLAKTGARLAIEVRGRTNDFLRKIEPFPFDEIKTGGAAILRFARTVRGPGLSAISELLELAEESNAAITAVGVEDQASLSALRSLGFVAAQGNHLGKVGQLNSFKPSRVNEVRSLLSLDPLNKDDLAAMFRTGAPEVQKPVEQKNEASPEKITRFPAADKGDLAEQDDDLLERLAARIAKNENPGLIEKSVHATPKPNDSARKAAAIARAKKKVEATPENGDDENPARDLQARLSEEFVASVENKKSTEAQPATEAKKETPPQKTKVKKAALKKAANKPVAKEKTADSKKASDKSKALQTAPAKETQSEEKAEAKTSKTPSAKSKKSTSKEAVSKDVKITDAAQDTSEQEKSATIEPTIAPEAPTEQQVASAKNHEDRLVVDGSVSKNAVMADPVTSDAAEITADMSVGEAHAHFLPVMRVGPERPEPEPFSDQPLSPLPEVKVHDPASLSVNTKESPASVEEEAVTRDDELDIDASTIGDLGVSEDDAAATMERNLGAASARIVSTRRRKPKNFLTRKYRIWPTHFWPKSWKRSWKRRAAYKAQMRAEQEAVE